MKNESGFLFKNIFINKIMSTFESFKNGTLPVFYKIEGGGKIENLGEYIRNYLRVQKEEIRIYLGTDSQKIGKKYAYVTAIVFYKQGKGGHVVYHKEYVKGRFQMMERLLKEVQMTYEIAEYLEVELNGYYKRIDDGQKLVDIDIDFNPDPGKNGENKSNAVYKQGVGWMEGCGYRVRTKPFATAAMSIADKLCK